MTFYEAALRVLEQSGTPLHVQVITQQAISRGLLSHVGKMPELTMLARLSAMAKRQRDRRLTVTAVDTFALAEWMLPEDAEALKATGVPPVHPELALPPLRPVERHPELRSDSARAGGRLGERRRRDEEGRRRRVPPLAELVFEVLSEAKAPRTAASLLAALQEREAVGDELTELALLEALAEDNARRLSDGRRPHFTASKPGDDAPAEVALDVPAGDVPPAVVQERFCGATGVRVDAGRFAGRGRAEAAAVVPAGEVQAEGERLAQAVKEGARDAKRVVAREFRRRLAGLESGALEKACVKLLHAHHFRELKVAKRGKEGPLFTARRRDGSLELRWAVRIVRGPGAVERRHVTDLRRDLGHYGAHAGLLLTTGDVRGEARSEAVGGGPLVSVWGGEHLAEKFFEAGVGVRVTRVELYEADGGFFELIDEEAEAAAQRREERLREKALSRREGGPRDERAPEVQGGVLVEDGPASALGAEDGTPIIAIPASVLESIVGGRREEVEDEDSDDEGPDDEGSTEGAGDDGLPEAAAPASGAEASAIGEAGRRKRRRRRRRRSAGPGAPSMGGEASTSPRGEAGGANASTGGLEVDRAPAGEAPSGAPAAVPGGPSTEARVSDRASGAQPPGGVDG